VRNGRSCKPKDPKLDTNLGVGRSLFDKGSEAKDWQGYLKLVVNVMNTHGSDMDWPAPRVFQLLLLGHSNASCFAGPYTLQPHNHYCGMTYRRKDQVASQQAGISK
jgi:hypothetical protein